MDISKKTFTITAPCDLYGRNARQFSRALNEHGGFVSIKKMGEDRTCNATSLIGLLSLGIRKGDTIQFVTRTGLDESGHILETFRKIVS